MPPWTIDRRDICVNLIVSYSIELLSLSALCHNSLLSKKSCSSKTRSVSSQSSSLSGHDNKYGLCLGFMALFSYFFFFLSVRLVNGLVDPLQLKLHAVSLNAIAVQICLPRSFVDLRHQATHQQLPSLPALLRASRDALEWLKTHYWEKQKLEVSLNPDSSRLILTEVVGFLRARAASLGENGSKRKGKNDAEAIQVKAERACLSKLASRLTVQSMRKELLPLLCSNPCLLLFLHKAQAQGSTPGQGSSDFEKSSTQPADLESFEACLAGQLAGGLVAASDFLDSEECVCPATLTMSVRRAMNENTWSHENPASKASYFPECAVARVFSWVWNTWVPFLDFFSSHFAPFSGLLLEELSKSLAKTVLELKHITAISVSAHHSRSEPSGQSEQMIESAGTLALANIRACLLSHWCIAIYCRYFRASAKKMSQHANDKKEPKVATSIVAAKKNENRKVYMERIGDDFLSLEPFVETNSSSNEGIDQPAQSQLKKKRKLISGDASKRDGASEDKESLLSIYEVTDNSEAESESGEMDSQDESMIDKIAAALLAGANEDELYADQSGGRNSSIAGRRRTSVGRSKHRSRKPKQKRKLSRISSISTLSHSRLTAIIKACISGLGPWMLPLLAAVLPKRAENKNPEPGLSPKRNNHSNSDARIATSFPESGRASLGFLSSKGFATLRRIVEVTTDSDGCLAYPIGGCAAPRCMADVSESVALDTVDEENMPLLSDSSLLSVRKVKSVAPSLKKLPKNDSKECRPELVFELCGEWTACPLGKLPVSSLPHSDDLCSHFDPMANVLKATGETPAETPTVPRDSQPSPANHEEPEPLKTKSQEAAKCAESRGAAMALKITAQELGVRIHRFQQGFNLI